LLPLIFREAVSERVANLVRDDDDIAVWWGTWAECAVAVSRLKREKSFDDETEENARARLDGLAADWTEIDLEDDLRLLTSLLSKDHPLKAADALQLAAALRWCEGDTRNKDFVCLDERLRRAARDEGFDVVPETLEPG
jgi:uncharacterized protein